MDVRLHGQPAVNAPVQLDVGATGGAYLMGEDGLPASGLEIRTDATGIARVRVWDPGAAVSGSVQIVAGSNRDNTLALNLLDWEEMHPARWEPVVPGGIQVDPAPLSLSEHAWNAGRTEDVLPLSNGRLLAATETSGVWLLEADGAATALSRDWAKPDLRTIVRGPDGPLHVFAAGDALYESQVQAANPLAAWRRIDMPLSSVFGAAVVPSTRRLVLAPGRWRNLIPNGDAVLWADIPPAGVGPRAFQWNKAVGLPDNSNNKLLYSGLAVSSPDSVLLSVYDRVTGEGNALLRGTWDAQGNLVFTAVPLPIGIAGLGRIMVASGDPRRGFCYAVIANRTDRGRFEAALRSEDGGRTWTRCSDTVEHGQGGKPLADVLGGAGNDRNLAVAVSPISPQLVAIGWQTGVVISRDGGRTWSQCAQGLHWHPDVAGLRWDETVETRLYLATDGGVMVTPDAGRTLESSYNRGFGNLQFAPVNRAEPLHWYGTVATSPRLHGLVGGGLQDNGTVYATPGAAHWKQFANGDGGIAAFLPNETAIFNIPPHAPYEKVQWWQWSTATPPEPVQWFLSSSLNTVPLAGGERESFLDAPVFELLPYQRGTARPWLGVALAQDGVYGLRATGGSPPLEWSRRATVLLPTAGTQSPTRTITGSAIGSGRWAAGHRGHCRAWTLRNRPGDRGRSRNCPRCPRIPRGCPRHRRRRPWATAR